MAEDILRAKCTITTYNYVKYVNSVYFFKLSMLVRGLELAVNRSRPCTLRKRLIIIHWWPVYEDDAVLL